MHGYVVFDNNAYKRTGRARLERIQDAERSQGIVALANAAVVQEMLARVRDANEEVRGRNRAALKKLVSHCSTVSGEQTELHFVTHLAGQIYRRVTGENAPGDEELFATFRELCRVVVQAEHDAPLTKIADHLDAIERHVEEKQRQYVSNLKHAPTAVHESNPMVRNLEFAKHLAVSALLAYGRPIPPPKQLMRAIIPIAQVSSITFALRDAVIQEVRAKGGGHEQHDNTVWDEEIVASTSLYSKIRGKTVVLVTTEPRLVRAAVQASAGDRVIGVEVYEESLGLDQWPPQSVSGASGSA
jgi:hypothetical protein